jgi:ribosomal protein L17
MNCLANSPDIAKYYLQQHNIKKRITKTLEINEKILEEQKEDQLEAGENATTEPKAKQLQEIVV